MTAHVTIMVLYSCEGCGIVERPVRVRERNSDEGVITWTQATVNEINADHEKNSPLCSSRTCDIKFPIANKNSLIGRAVRQ